MKSYAKYLMGNESPMTAAIVFLNEEGFLTEELA